VEIAMLVARIKRYLFVGPDGILRKHFTKPDTQEVLRLFYCLITACGTQPNDWRENRTKLLLKDGKDPARADSYRLVTIGSLLNRIFWEYSTRNSITLSASRHDTKGFVNEAGCFNDVHILNEVIKLAKKGPGLLAVQLDISKTIATMPHQAIEWAQLRKGVPEYLAKH
jgi:hypothetical protein